MVLLHVSVCVCFFVKVCVCVSLRHGRRFWFFRAVQRRPLQGRGVGGRRGRHAQLWGSLASGHGHSPPHFLWWTDGPCSAWLQKKTADGGEDNRTDTFKYEKNQQQTNPLKISVMWKQQTEHSQKDINIYIHKHACTKTTKTCLCLCTHYIEVCWQKCLTVTHRWVGQ